MENIEQRQRQIIIGMDAGYRNFGISIVDVTDTDDIKKFKFIHLETIVTKRENKKFNIKVATDDVFSIMHTLNRIREIIDDNCDLTDKMLIAAEIPTGGSQSSIAAKSMGFATAMTVAISVLYDIPAIYVDPRDVKSVVTGRENASKIFIMSTLALHFGGNFKLKKGTKNKYLFMFNGNEFHSNEFEHIADSIGAIMYAVDTSQYRLWKN